MAASLSRLIDGYERLSRVVCRPRRSLGAYIPRRGVVERLFSLLDKGLVPLVYGPRGAGKTTLLRCLAMVLSKLGLRSVYVGLHSKPPVVFGEAPAQLRGLLEKLGDSRDGVVRGALVAQAARILGKGSLLIIDDFDYGLRETETGMFVRALYESLSMAEDVASIILATSEARIAATLHRVLVGNIVPSILWHMGREEHDELARLLGYRGDAEKLYAFTGGSPDALVSIREHDWLVEEWVEYRVKPRVEEALAELAEMGITVDTLNPDVLGSRRVARYILLKHNLFAGLRGYRLSVIEKSGWIGDKWAWQLPVYAEVASQLIEAYARRRIPGPVTGRRSPEGGLNPRWGAGRMTRSPSEAPS